jgi:hypothetical protein
MKHSFGVGKLLLSLFLLGTSVSSCKSRSFEGENSGESQSVENTAEVAAADKKLQKNLTSDEETKLNMRPEIKDVTTFLEPTKFRGAERFFQKSEIDLVSERLETWNCLERPEVVLCQGKNGSGAGEVIWVLYRGVLAEAKNVRMKLKIMKSLRDVAPVKLKSGLSFLITNGIQSCKKTTLDAGYEDNVATKCKDSSSDSKKFFESILKDAEMDGIISWKVNIMFYSPGGPNDFGNPFYRFQF